MKKCYVHLERLPDSVIKKCFVKAELKHEIKTEDHDHLDVQNYNDNISQPAFLLFEIWIFRTRIISIIFKSTLIGEQTHRRGIPVGILSLISAL